MIQFRMKTKNSKINLIKPKKLKKPLKFQTFQMGQKSRRTHS